MKARGAIPGKHSQSQVLFQAFRHPFVELWDGVWAGAETQVLDEGLVGVVGGVEEAVDSLHLRGTHDGEVQLQCAVLELTYWRRNLRNKNYN